MGLSEDPESALHKKHTDICDKLGLDTKILDEAWASFQSISKNYTLEGDELHWLCCAIFAACWQSNYLQRGGQNVEASEVNLNCTSLLRHCNLSLAQFFFNIRHWASMSNMSEMFLRRIDTLERTFAVSSNIFKEYQTIFLKVFNVPEFLEGEIKQRIRKQKTVPCTTAKVFEFCWALFITVKKNDKYSNELVTLSHLLIAIVDWAFANAFLGNRKDLLNPHFEGLPSNWIELDFQVPEEAPCIVSLLCGTSDMITDVKYLKEYLLKDSVQDLFDKQILLSNNEEECNDVFNPSYFERNFRNLMNGYESSCLSEGDLDERIFLAEYRRKLCEKGLQQRSDPTVEITGDISGEFSNSLTGQECLTPLTGRKYLTPRGSLESSSLSSFEDNVQKLTALLADRQPAASETLVQLFEVCDNNPLEKVQGIVQRLGDKFIASWDTEQAPRWLSTAKTLFYKLIENILQSEKAINPDISRVVEREPFYECMFTCSLEIVIHCYAGNSARRKGIHFPWILEALEVPSYNFVKVIELIIRSKDKLSRGVIKHLNMIEETILSSLVWKSDSLIWEAIETCGQEIPKFEEIALPGHLQYEQIADNIKANSVPRSESHNSPAPSVADRFQSPVTHSSTASRELFGATQSDSFFSHPLLVIEDGSGATKTIPIINHNSGKKIPPPISIVKDVRGGKPKRTGGVAIILRKFYHLAWERQEHLCVSLGITTLEMKRKMWTVFEAIVCTNNCQLIKDRDLDQLLMCSVYMICKTEKTNKTFVDIMKMYRTQPQATSDIYRNVLVSSKSTKVVDGQTSEIPEKRSDLIWFYNNVIVPALRKFVEKFLDAGECPGPDAIKLLSPLPTSRRQLVSPGFHVLENITVKPLDSPTANLPNGKGFTYIFNRSPSKNLQDINQAIRGSGITRKRLLIESDSEIPNAKRIANKKVQSLIEERRSQSIE